MIPRDQVHEGMRVRSADGKRLGHVLFCDETSFVVEKRFFSLIDYIARYEDVAAVTDRDILLSRPRRELAQVSRDPFGGTYGDGDLDGRDRVKWYS